MARPSSHFTVTHFVVISAMLLLLLLLLLRVCPCFYCSCIYGLLVSTLYANNSSPPITPSHNSQSAGSVQLHSLTHNALHCTAVQHIDAPHRTARHGTVTQRTACGVNES